MNILPDLTSLQVATIELFNRVYQKNVKIFADNPEMLALQCFLEGKINGLQEGHEWLQDNSEFRETLCTKNL